MPSHQHSQPRPQAPERRALPIVLDEADVVQRRVDADRLQRPKIEVLEVGRVRLQDDLELIIMLQPVGVLAIAPVLGAARGLHVGGAPRLRAERAQRGRRVEGARAHLHVVGLQDDAALLRPIALEREDQPLKGARRVHVRGFAGHSKKPKNERGECAAEPLGCEAAQVKFQPAYNPSRDHAERSSTAPRTSDGSKRLV